MIYYITGGERSGKSKYAQTLALSLTENPIYIATARKWDDDFKLRIKNHQLDRDSRWTSIEEEKNIHLLNLVEKVAVVDCVTLWLTNFYTDNEYQLATSLSQAKEIFDKLIVIDSTIILISNEIGMGIHAETEIGRKFVELQGWMNQYIASKADKAFFMVSGIPLLLK